MATKKQKAKQAKQNGLVLLDVSREMLQHFKYLGVKDAAEYQEWCIKNKFSTNLEKNYRQRDQELLFIRRQKAEAILILNKSRKPEVIIGEWLDKYGSGIAESWLVSQDSQNFPSQRVKELPPLPTGYADVEKVLEAALKKSVNCLKEVKKLIRHILKVSSDVLFEVIDSQNHKFISTFAAIASFSANYVRPLEKWEPKSHNSRRQFSSLLRHLFGKYAIPSFMDQCWLENPGVDANRYQNWFIHLGTGQNFRTAPLLPVAITKKQAHLFCEAPDDFSILGAIRYGQILSLGGNRRLATALLPTRLCELQYFAHDEFWQSVIRWFIENPMLDMVHVGPIVDWLQNQKFDQQRVFIGPGVVDYLPPPQPNLSMKKRDPITTLRSIEEWHRQLGRAKRAGNLQWVSSGIKGFEFIEGQGDKMRIWKITELLSGKELTEEGKQMHHCVASYASSCHSGRITIFSMTSQNHEGTLRQLTIEVNTATKSVIQARGKWNAAATQQQKNVMARWAPVAGVNIGRYV